jgi:hypothetical protein
VRISLSKMIVLALSGTLAVPWMCGSCSRGTERSARKPTVASTSLPVCRIPSVNSEGWVSVKDTNALITFRVPEGSHVIRSSGIWATPFGSVSLIVNNHDGGWLDSLLSDPSTDRTGWCKQSDGEWSARVQAHDGAETFGKGQYALAFWPLKGASGVRELELVGFARDSTDLALLFGVIRSVQFFGSMDRRARGGSP